MSFNEHFENGLISEMSSVLIELRDLMQDVIDGSYKPDSFTLQPSNIVLDKVMNYLNNKSNTSIEKQSEPTERKTAEIPSDIVQKMQHEFEPNPDTSFKQGMYSGYAFGLQDGYKFASQSLPEINNEE